MICFHLLFSLFFLSRVQLDVKCIFEHTTRFHNHVLSCSMQHIYLFWHKESSNGVHKSGIMMQCRLSTYSFFLLQWWHNELDVLNIAWIPFTLITIIMHYHLRRSVKWCDVLKVSIMKISYVHLHWNVPKQVHITMSITKDMFLGSTTCTKMLHMRERGSRKRVCISWGGTTKQHIQKHISGAKDVAHAVAVAQCQNDEFIYCVGLATSTKRNDDDVHIWYKWDKVGK